jgi:hypothetical protein
MKLVPKEGTGHYIFKVWCSTDHYTGCSYGYIHLPQEEKDDISEKLQMFCDYRLKHKDLEKMCFWTSMFWIASGDSPQAHTYEMFEDVDEILESNNFVEIERLDTDPLNHAGISADRIAITDAAFSWEGTCKDSSEIYHTPKIWSNELETFGIRKPTNSRY